ncbi:uncharacterized protein C11orf91 homolog [Hyperolius riggenbachi]|uniref:uncharacterized protein C11orf91 homolog n=1 Tax=Hyperolius riggenbachi TaxID=752182 RepID=UPI0035A35605
MAKPWPNYFPSLHDPDFATFPAHSSKLSEEHEMYLTATPEAKDVSTQGDGPKQVQAQAEEMPPWPNGLSDISYDPLSFFYTPHPEDFKPPQPSHEDHWIEQEIQHKQEELMAIILDRNDISKDFPLNTRRKKIRLRLKTKL